MSYRFLRRLFGQEPPSREGSGYHGAVEMTFGPNGIEVAVDNVKDAAKASRMAFLADQILEAWRAFDEAVELHERTEVDTSDGHWNAGMDHLDRMAKAGHRGAQIIRDPWTDELRDLVERVRDSMDGRAI